MDPAAAYREALQSPAYTDAQWKNRRPQQRPPTPHQPSLRQAQAQAGAAVAQQAQPFIMQDGQTYRHASGICIRVVGNDVNVDCQDALQPVVAVNGYDMVPSPLIDELEATVRALSEGAVAAMDRADAQAKLTATQIVTEQVMTLMLRAFARGCGVPKGISPEKAQDICKDILSKWVNEGLPA